MGGERWIKRERVVLRLAKGFVPDRSPMAESHCVITPDPSIRQGEEQ